MDTAVLVIGGSRVQVEMARTDEEIERGLMHRRSMAGDAGMLFVLDPVRKACFWMKNTFIPLSLAFIGEDGVIRQIEDMEATVVPDSEDVDHCESDEPCRYVLETNRGWFREHGVGPGVAVEGIPA